MDKYIENAYAETLALLKELCLIPAPSNHEEARAAFCKKWFEEQGAEGVYIDDALNVIFPYQCEGKDNITVLAAHTDTVFPDMTPLPYREDAEKVYCPGVGDDTASLAVLMMTAKYFIKNKIVAPNGILFVCNAAEEGLGDLKGTRKLMQDYHGRIGKFITFDTNLDIIHPQCVGSHRYLVEVKTEGGHSFQKFGNPNAIAVLSDIIGQIYQIEVPEIEGARTTYNVGTIEGGTSVNTIAQNASMLCEYRSDHKDALAFMKERFFTIFQNANRDGVEVHVKQVGDRPCAGDVDTDKLNALVGSCKAIVEDVIKEPVILKSASTDCNIPLSLGIPAVCVGVYTGDLSHTREEWVLKESLKPGLEIAIKIAKTQAID